MSDNGGLPPWFESGGLQIRRNEVSFPWQPREKQTMAKMFMKHCPDYDMILKMHYPTIKTTDLEVCRFLLIGLSEQQIAVLLQKDYSTIWKRIKRLRELMGVVEPKMHLIRLLFEQE